MSADDEPSHLLQTVALLEEVFDPVGCVIWLRTEHRTLGSRPIDLIQRGYGERVVAELQRLCDGNL